MVSEVPENFKVFQDIKKYETFEKDFNRCLSKLLKNYKKEFKQPTSMKTVLYPEASDLYNQDPTMDIGTYQRLVAVWRKVASICHPDKKTGNAELFQYGHFLYVSRDLDSLTKFYESLRNGDNSFSYYMKDIIHANIEKKKSHPFYKIIRNIILYKKYPTDQEVSSILNRIENG